MSRHAKRAKRAAPVDRVRNRKAQPGYGYALVPHIGTCPDCGRLRFAARGDAKDAARTTGGDVRQTVYRCGDYWHVGPLGLARPDTKEEAS